MNQPKNPKDSFLYAFGIYSTVGIQLVACVLIGTYIGHWADNKLNTEPWLMMGGLALGTAAGFYSLVRMVNRFRNL